MQMKVGACLLCLMLLVPRAVHAAEEAAAETVTIQGKTYTVVSDDEFRALGFDVPDVTPEENAAYDYIEAINSYVAPDAEQEDLRDTVLQGTWTEEAGPLADYIERNARTVELLKAAATKDVCHFPVLVSLGSSIEERSPLGIMLPQLAPMRQLARFLVAEGKAYEFEARYEEALDTYLLALRLGNHMAQGPTLIGGLVGLACNQIGARAIEQWLVRNEIDDETLLNAQKRLATLAEGRPSVMTSMRGERAWSTSIMEYMMEHPAVLDDFIEGGTDLGAIRSTALTAMFMSDEGRAQVRADAKAFWDATEAAMAMPLRAFIETGAGDEPVRKAHARKFPPNIMGLLGPAPGGARLAFARNAVAWTVLDVEFALARHKAKHGAYPETLDEVKDLMLSDGIDPYSGERLKYRLEDDGAFTIWSVGKDLKDGGGKVETKHDPWRGGDYVWNSRVLAGTK